MWGQQLGCASSYTVTLHYRGGQRVYAYPEAVTSVEWSRARRGVSEATVELSKQSLSPECAALMVDVWPLTHEVTIYRDDRAVWQGLLMRRPMVRGQEERRGGTEVRCGWGPEEETEHVCGVG